MINGIGISTAANGAGMLIMAFVIGHLTDTDGHFGDVIVLSGSMCILAGILAAIISLISNCNKQL